MSRNTGFLGERPGRFFGATLPAMFCPQCRVEYRPGFTHCADCDVDLVPSLSRPEKPSLNAPPSGSLQILWEGEDLALFENLLDALEAAGIRYFDQPLGIYPGVRRTDPFPIKPLARFGYQVAVLSSELGRAREILGKLLGEEPEDMELPAQDEERGEKVEGTVPQEEDLSCEVWSGSDERLAEFIESGLKENAVQTRRGPRGTELSIYVPSAEEATAREIVREIVEGAPPNPGEQE